MARSVRVIDKDLRALEGQAADLGKQFQQVYESYLQRLGEVLRHQLALAGYQLCTQKYPSRVFTTQAQAAAGPTKCPASIGESCCRAPRYREDYG